MDITGKAKGYAEEKTLTGIKALVEQAYLDGYNDGMKHHENEMLDRIKNGVEYVDLGLPSGTLWSRRVLVNKGSAQEMPYLEASKLNIPTIKQFEELFSQFCNLHYYNTSKKQGIEFKGITGDLIFAYGVDIFFWLKDEEDSTEKNCASIILVDGKYKPVIKKVFMGLKLPVMLVMNK